MALEQPKRRFWPLIDGVPLNFILSLPAVRVWLFGSLLVVVAQSGYFAAGSTAMLIIGALLNMFGVGGAAAARPPKPEWSLDQYNQWRIKQGLAVITEEEWRTRRGLSGAYQTLQPPTLPPPPMRPGP